MTCNRSKSKGDCRISGIVGPKEAEAGQVQLVDPGSHLFAIVGGGGETNITLFVVQVEVAEKWRKVPAGPYRGCNWP